MQLDPQLCRQCYGTLLAVDCDSIALRLWSSALHLSLQRFSILLT